jgi:hypothetical protein
VTPRRIGVIPDLNKDERPAALGADRTGSPLVQYSQLQPGQAPHLQARLMPGVDRLTHCLHSTYFMELEKIGDLSISQCRIEQYEKLGLRPVSHNHLSSFVVDSSISSQLRVQSKTCLYRTLAHCTQRLDGLQLWERRQVSQIPQPQIVEKRRGGGKQAVIVQGDQLALQQCADDWLAPRAVSLRWSGSRGQPPPQAGHAGLGPR